MKWNDYKKKMTALDASEIKHLEIVALLIQRRQELQLTQSQLAEKCGLEQAAVVRLESEKATPRLDTLEKVTEALGLELTLVKEDNTTYTSKQNKF